MGRAAGAALLAMALASAACRGGTAAEPPMKRGAEGERAVKAEAETESGSVTGSESGSESGSGSGSGSGSESGSESGSGSPAISASPPSPPLSIVDTPIAWSDERAALTLEYRRRHESPDTQDLTIAPRVVVLHYTGGNSAKGTKSYFDRLTMEASREQLARAGKVNVSSHYLIDRDGTIYRLQPETRFARHCIGLNHIAIGIENVGDEARWPLTEAQVKANAELVRDLASRFSITHLLGHYEVMKFRAHPYYVERDASYRNRKPDPGPRFLAAVRAQVADLGLAGLAPADDPDAKPKK